MRTVGILVARRVAIALLVAVLLLPQIAYARPVAAPVMLGCAKWGYTMQLPADWTTLHPCSDGSAGLSPHGQTLTIFVSVELHTWWSDQRSRDSIMADMKGGQTLTEVITWLTPTIHGTRYILGADIVKPDGGGANMFQIELETFTHHHLFQILTFYDMTDDKNANVANEKKLVSIFNTMVVTGVPDSMQTPKYKAPGPTPVIPTPLPTVQPEAADLQIAYELASIQYGYRPTRDDPMVARFARDLVVLHVACRQSQATVSDELVRAWQLDDQYGGTADLIGVADALVTVMQGAGAKAGVSCTDALALFVKINTSK